MAPSVTVGDEQRADDESESAEFQHDYELVQSAKVDDTIPVQVFKCKSTGIRVVIAQVPGPIVNGYLLVPTEAHDDDGLPHTLEHLIFLGSEDYPYKGVLDMLANRCFAQGTNAWTDTDHTVYTVETAGSQGFLNFLPVYVEHILYPTLSDSAFLTEVYHVNESGEDAGVVYCEMQGRENTGESLTNLAMLRAIYPGHCGYKSETGGLMENLRESTTNVKVCNYHYSYYRPDNLTLIITGQVEPSLVFQSMAKLDDKIRAKLAKNPLSYMERPWSSPVPDFTESVTQTVLFPNDSEDKGMVTIAFRSLPATEIYKSLCLGIILDYFVDTSVAPLRQAFVENDDPDCSNVKWSAIEATAGTAYFRFVNVHVGRRLDNIAHKFFMTMRAELDKGLSMTRIRSIIARKRLEALNNLEDAPHEAISGEVIGHILFGQDDQDLVLRLNSVKMYARCLDEVSDFWVDIIKDMIEKPHVVIIGRPSRAEQKRLAEETEARIQRRKDELGESGLALKGQQLEAAVAENEKEVPDEMMSCLDVPDADKIDFHNIKVSSNYRRTDDKCGLPLDRLPFTVHLDDIAETQFIAWCILMDSSKLRPELKPYLMLWTELIGETAVQTEGGDVMPYEAVVEGLERDLLDYACHVGVTGGRFSAGSFSEIVSLYMKVDRDLPRLEKYWAGVGWAHRLLFRQQFQPDRVKSVVHKILNAADQVKRQGRAMVNAIYLKALFHKYSNSFNCIITHQEKLLKDVLVQLESNSQLVIDTLNEITELLTRTENMRVHLTTAVGKFDRAVHVVDPWMTAFMGNRPEDVTGGEGVQRPPAFRPVKGCEVMNPLESIYPKSAILGIGAVESSFLIHSAFTGLTAYEHPDVPALMVLIEYMIALEGPMWKLIRGMGFSYGYHIALSIETGQIIFSLTKATNITKAYEKGMEIVMGFVDGSSELDEVTLETTKSSVMYEIIEREKTIGDATMESMMNHLRGVPKTYNKTLLHKVSLVTMADVEAVCKKYMAGLFDPRYTMCAVVCHPSKVEDVIKGFQELRHHQRFLFRYESVQAAFS